MNRCSRVSKCQAKWTFREFIKHSLDINLCLNGSSRESLLRANGVFGDSLNIAINKLILSFRGIKFFKVYFDWNLLIVLWYNKKVINWCWDIFHLSPWAVKKLASSFFHCPRASVKYIPTSVNNLIIVYWHLVFWEFHFFNP